MDAKKFGAFIAGQRKSLGLTQLELAEKLHVTDKAVSRWERGLGFPDINSIEPLADALGLSIAEIMKSEKSVSASSDANASSAAKNVIHMVALKREEEKKTVIVTAGAALLIFCVLLIDVMGPMGFVGAALPCFCLTAGMALFFHAVMRWRRRLPLKTTVFWAMIFTALPIACAILFFMAGASGIGPIPD